MHQPFKLNERFFVKNDVIQFILLQTRGLKAILDGIGGKACIVLFAREPLFLRGRNNFAVMDEGCGAVMVKG